MGRNKGVMRGKKAKKGAGNRTKKYIDTKNGL